MNAILSSLAVVLLATTAIFAHLNATAATALRQTFEAANALKIAASQLAVERAQSKEVKSFAQLIISEHASLWREFQEAVRKTNLGRQRHEPDAEQKATLAKLSMVEGEEFDAVYLAAQLRAHMELLPLLRTYSQRGLETPLKHFAQKARAVMERHLRMSQRLSRSTLTSGVSR
jgi:putative membrane protein